MCENHYIHKTNFGTYDYCSANKVTKTDCVTGKITTTDLACESCNLDGNCKKFKLNKAMAERLKLVDILKKRLKENTKIKNICHTYTGHRDTLEDILIYNLISCLKNNDPDNSDDFYEKYISYDNDDETLCEGHHFFIKEDGRFHIRNVPKKKEEKKKKHWWN